jgi:hypothetical protein
MGIYNPHSGDWFGMGFMDFGDFSCVFFGGKPTKWMDIFVTILVKHGNITITRGYLGKPTGNG